MTRFAALEPPIERRVSLMHTAVDACIALRTVQRWIASLFVQIERILRTNDLSVITDDVVEAARSTLVVGAT